MAESGPEPDGRTIARRKKDLKAQRRGYRTSVTLRCDRFDEEYQRDPRDMEMLTEHFSLLRLKLVALREIDDQLRDLWTDDELDAEADAAFNYQNRADEVLVQYRALRSSRRSGQSEDDKESLHSGASSYVSRREDMADRLKDVTDISPRSKGVIPLTEKTRNPSLIGSVVSETIPMQHISTSRRVSNIDTGGQLAQRDSNEGLSTNRPLQPTARVKLPKLELKSFNGDVYEWQAFADHFTSSIVENPSLTDVDRLLYLKSCCRGPAYRTIASLSSTGKNFSAAWSMLSEQFGRERTLIQAHIEALQNLKPISDLSRVVSFRQLYSDIQGHLQGLDRLDTPTEAMSAILVPCILRSLPLEFVAKCERHQLSSNRVSVQDLMGFIKRELEAYEQAVKSRGAETRSGTDNTRRVPEVRRPATASSLTTFGRRLDRLAPCAFCGGSHRHAECPKFTNSGARRDALRKSSRCFKCLNSGHISNRCPQQFCSCPKCKGPHHVTLCDRSSERVDVKFASMFDCSRVLLQTLGLCVAGEKRGVQVRVVLDLGSQISFIETGLARSIGARKCREGLLQIDPFGGKGVVQNYAGYSVSLQGLDEKSTLRFNLVGVPKICSEQKVMDDPRCIGRLRELGHHIADKSAGANDQIRLLIGSNYYWRIVTGRTEWVDEDLVLVETVFGWVVSGCSKSCKRSHSSTMVGLTNIHSDLEKFWEIEHLGIKEEVSSEGIQDDVLRRFEETLERDEDGRYVVRLPWNDRVKELRSNEVGASCRLRKLLWKLEKDRKLCDQYRGAMNDYMNAGFVELVDETVSTKGPTFYLPHHAIVKEERKTTKVRVVFDASAHETGSPSLNECLHAGPRLLPDLTSLLVRFRSYQVAFIGDIAKAFLQVALNVEDRDAVRLLWVDDGYWSDRGSGDRLQRHRIMLRKTVVLFGASSSPFLLNATIKIHVKGYAGRYPEAVFLLNSCLYVDDLIGGADSVDEAFKLSGQCRSILGEAKLPLRKWDSSSAELLALWKQNGEEIADEELTFDDEVGKVKVLGVRWRRVSDCFTFDWQEVSETTWTKRRMLSLMASIYDPMGFVAPYTVVMKILMQSMWKCGIGWDESMAGEITQRWITWLHERPLLNRVRVTRVVYK